MNKGTKNHRLSEEDFYYDKNGALVFTENYHKKRGYCCQNGCRHCPWNYRSKDSKFLKP